MSWDAALIGTYKAIPIHSPGSVLVDLAVAIADGADSSSDLKVLPDHPEVFGPAASTPPLGGAHLPLLTRAGPPPEPESGPPARDPISIPSCTWTSTPAS
ncbi:MAG: hypothetical protein ACYCTI_03570 [Acidimicrobiales bacterium]